ncbi:MAG: phosphoribosylamine--glycine ligase [Pseudomonadota bacterium]|nr:phosphoribosylamine--glycine ligase [Pseudomonadota bacterium]
MMKILLIGSGGREHALAWAISGSAMTETLLIAPGSDAMAALGRCVDVAADDLDGLLALAEAEQPDLVVVGPEAPLVAGLVDRLTAAGFAAFGPSAAAARLEGSKAFAREACARFGIHQPGFTVCRDMDTARAAIAATGGACVIKADGLAAGKGVVVADDAEEAMTAAADMLNGRFGDAGATLLVEERITGPEASLFALVDGADVLFMGSAQDHKRAYDGDKGPNTGGMGAVSPAPRLDEALQAQVMEEIVSPLARGMADEAMPYRGILYVGLMLTDTGPQVIEFNCRLGDPEAQVILPRLRSDFVAAMLATIEGTLGHVSLRWDERSAVTVVMAAKGYPGSYEKGSVIAGAETAAGDDVMLFHAGTKIDADGTLRAHGGRVLAVTGLGRDVGAARGAAYGAVDKIGWPGGFCRRDIAAE